ncbi:MAG: MBOAT family protein [Lachnospiraceae bacterium]|nr:MBOAT family protein [Lachnospiraceae bacterium]
MLFNSAIFIFVFLPLCLAGWYGLNHFGLYRPALWFLSISSLIFYGYFHPAYLLLILASVLINYGVLRAILRFRKASKLLLALGVLANLGILGYFKYCDFFLSTVNGITGSNIPLRNILLPLGISFYTLQQLSCLTDAYRGKESDYRFDEYLTFVTFFPQLIAGPIVLSEELIPRFRDLSLRRFDAESFASGLSLFILGLAKKVLVADLFGRVVDFGFEKIYWIDTASAWVVGLCYSIQLYFDFSGYCDMARGLAEMFRFPLPENFAQPFKAFSIKDHWDRWHMTLTRFFTRYVYIPLGGSRKGRIRTAVNIFLVFAVSGLWHGAAWTYLIWGALQGVGVLWSRRKFLRLKPGVLSWFFTFSFIVASQLIFRSGDLDFMRRMLTAMFTPKGVHFLPELASCLAEAPEFYMITRAAEALAPGALNALYLILLALMLLVAALLLRGRNAAKLCADAKAAAYPKRFIWLLALLFTAVVVSLNQVSTFLYFNF